jgi:hypothetical protein
MMGVRAEFPGTSLENWKHTEAGTKQSWTQLRKNRWLEGEKIPLNRPTE